jgi:membrane-bound lytic murein transglycosylase A
MFSNCLKKWTDREFICGVSKKMDTFAYNNISGKEFHSLYLTQAALFGQDSACVLSMRKQMILKLMPVVLFLVAGSPIGPARAEPPRPVALGNLPGWEQDALTEVWPAWQNSCLVLRGEPMWQPVCLLAEHVDGNDPAAVRRYFATQFVAEPVLPAEGEADALFTGYYEPVVRGSRVADARYRYPLYGLPTDWREGVPYAVRADIDSGRVVPPATVIAYLDSDADRFFAHVQGSCKIALPDGSRIAAAYAGNNGHTYRAIGRMLVEQGEIAPEKMSMQAIRAWLAAHPQRATEVMWSNPRYIFFSERPAKEEGPLGALALPLTPRRSVAVDPGRVRLGAPVWIDTTLSGTGEPYRRLMAAHDKGAAIQGLRADIFFGTGEWAGQAAGAMKQRGKMWVLKPKYPPLMLADAAKEAP